MTAATVAGEQLRYWREQLAGSTRLDLPVDRPWRAARTGDGAGHDFVIDAGLAGGMRALASAHGATPFMMLLAAWSALLGRLCDSRDVVTGACTADQPEPGGGPMATGMLVIRTRLSAGLPAAGLLAAVRETTLEAFANSGVPFERLVAELAPDRGAAHATLVNVALVDRNGPAGGQDTGNDRPGPPAFDLTLAVRDRPDGSLHCRLEYRAALFDAPTIARVGRCLRRLLAGFVGDQDRPVDRLPILDAGERAELLAASAAPAAPEAALPGPCLHTAIARQAERVPGAVAVACGGVELTYAELDARANRLANHLRGQGVGPETGVAVRLPRSADQVVAMLAVWRAGGYYLPMDDEHPAERIAMMLADAAPLVLVTRGADGIASGEAAGQVKITCLDRDAADIAGQPSGPPGVRVGPDGLAAAIFTSGSTGTPKAVALTHRNVLSAQAGRAAYQAPPRSLLLPVSFAFDVFLSFAAWTLCSGGRLVIPVQPRGADLDELAMLLLAHRVTHLVGPPDLQRALLGMERVRAGNDLTIGVVGGQSCPGVLADDYAAATAGARLVNEYGLTETSAGTWFITGGQDGGSDGCAYGGEDRGEDHGGQDHGVQDRGGLAGQLPIGRPAAGYRVYLLDAELEPVPPGVPGEVYVGGPGVARGYLGRPALTAERFRPDPFGAEPGGRLYRTGDLACRRGDGTLVFLGRRDQQVKVRGFRIEPAEVEAALLRHESVAAAAVVLAPQRQELVAYVADARSGDGDTRLDGAMLGDHLRRLLPAPMVPAAFRVLPAMPLTPNGKIDRAALAAMAAPEAAEPCPPNTAARTPAERVVAEVWAEALEVDAAGIDVHADFFKIGGHSLLAAGVVSALRARFPVPITLPDLFGSPTVAGLAGLISSRAEDAGGRVAGPAETQAPTQAPAPVQVLVGVRQPDAASGAAAWDGTVLVWLRRDGGGDPLVCVHPGDGAVHWYADLAAATGRPLAALRWPQRHDGPAGIESVARRYLAELRAARPHGPYRLLGWCGGTPVTWELARLLAADGEAVRLWLLDPLVDVARRTESASQLALFRESEALFDPASLAEPAALAGRDDPAEAARRRADLVASLRISAGPGVPATEDEVRRQLRAGRELLEAGMAYEFRPFPGRLGLLIGDEVPTGRHVVMGGQGYQQFLARWRELATGGVDVHRVRGGHYEVLRPPQVTALAGVLGGEVERS